MSSYLHGMRARFAVLSIMVLAAGAHDAATHVVGIVGIIEQSRGIQPATTSASFGMVDDKPVQLYTLTNRNGLVAKITNYGAIVTELHVPDRAGKLADVVLGFETLDDYVKGHPYFGAIVGRVANRIGNAEFTLEGKRYKLAANDKPHHLHGGTKGWDKVVWSATADRDAEGSGARADVRVQGRRGGLSGHRDGEDGLHADQRQRAQGRHAGDDRQDDARQHGSPQLLEPRRPRSAPILDHELTLHADKYTPGTPMVPDGRVMPVKGTPFDFTTAKAHRQGLKPTGGTPVGYDHNFVVNGEPNGCARWPGSRIRSPAG